MNQNQIWLRQQAGLTAKQLRHAHTICCEGDPKTPSVEDRTKHIIGSIGQSLKPYSADLLDAYQTYGDDFIKTGSDLQRQQSLGEQYNDTDLINGPQGRWLLDKTLEAQKRVDPELFANRALLGKKQSELYNDVERLNGFSGTERAEANRYMARSDAESGNSGLGGSSNVLANAMRFGALGRANDAQYIAAKQGAIGTGAAISPALKSGIDSYQLLTGKSAGNLGGSQFNPSQTSQNLLGSTTQLSESQTVRDGQRRDTVDRINESIGSYS